MNMSLMFNTIFDLKAAMITTCIPIVKITLRIQSRYRARAFMLPSKKFG